MDYNRLSKHDLTDLPTPCYLVDEQLLVNNLRLLAGVQQQAGCDIILALKAFAMYSLFPVIKDYLQGVSASSLHEARLGREKFGKEVHTFAPAYVPDEIEEIIEHSDYLIFNSFQQWRRFKNQLNDKIKCGLRINPEYSEIAVDIYNPCAKNSRLGIPLKNFENDLEGISGLHFHAMCEQNSDTLIRILKVVEEKFGNYLHQLEWINFGGGHHITRDDYHIAELIAAIQVFRKRYKLRIIMEPGEAVALHTGVLVATVLEIMHNEIDIAILDTSAEAHMPDVMAMPYRPDIIGADEPGKQKHTYRLTGLTCLAGDIIGDYSFQQPLEIGDKLLFTDMAHYTMVKNNTFNGVKLPSIAILKRSGALEVVKRFGYQDYKSRLS